MSWPEIAGKVISLDTETTGLGYTDRPVGSSISFDDEDHYFAWGHPDENSCSLGEFRRWSNDQLPRAKSIVMHSGPFDMRMLDYEGMDVSGCRVEDTGIICGLLNELEPNFQLDGLCQKYTGQSKSDDELNAWCADRFGGRPTRKGQAGNYHRAPGRIVAPYAKGDSRMTLDLYNARRHLLVNEDLEKLYELELAQLPIVLRMHRAGVKVNQDRAEATAHDLDRKLKEAKAWLDRFAPGLNWNSTKQVAALFDSLGITYVRNPPTPKMIERGVTVGNASITKEDLERLADEGFDFAKYVVDSRRFKHYADTFIRSYILSNIVGDFVHGEFHPMKRESYGTVSGRYSSGGALNLQNIPARDPYWAPLIRGLYIPISNEHDWWRFDYSQIEYRYLAHYAGGNLRKAYQRNPDVDFHQFVADLAGMPRKPAKNLNFAVVYGQGFRATQAQLGMNADDTAKFLNTYHAAVPEAKRLMNRAMNLAAKRGHIITWAGRRRRFQKGSRGQYRSLHKALNALLQGSAADLVKKAMVEVDKVIDWDEAVMHLTVHDELDLSLPKGDVGMKYARQIKEAMESFDLTVPIKVDAEVGPDWGHCEEVDLAA